MSQRNHRVVVQIIDVLDTYRKKSRARSLLLLRFKSDAEHLTTPLAPVEVSIMLPVEQNSFTIDLLKAPRGHQPAQGILDSASAVTTWRISIDELKLVGRHEVSGFACTQRGLNGMLQVLLRGQGGSWPANVAVHVALTTIPIGTGEVPPRRPGDAPMMLDRQGFPVCAQWHVSAGPHVCGPGWCRYRTSWRHCTKATWHNISPYANHGCDGGYPLWL